MAKAIRRSGVRRVPLSEIEKDLSRFLREAENEEIVIIRDGKPAGVLIGFGSEDDWLDYRLENDPRFLMLNRIVWDFQHPLADAAIIEHDDRRSPRPSDRVQ